MLSSLHTSERWNWPAGRVIVLYRWRWFDPELGEVISGWSQSSDADDAGYIDLEADALHEAHTRHIDPNSRPFVVVEPYTFTSMASLPPLLLQDGGPQAWIRILLGPNM